MESSRRLQDWISGFLKYTSDTESPESFKLWTAISVVAAALQRKCYIHWGPSLVFYPNLYIVLVGPSGCRKGTAMGPGLDLLRDSQIQVAANATTWQALVRKLQNNNLTDINPDTGEMHFHSSLTIYSKEFTVFLGYQNKELMSALCDWYDCDRSWTYETVQRSEEKITGVWVNLLGATTPDLIPISLPIESIGGGLTSRIIFVYEEGKGKIIPIQIADGSLSQLYEDLLFDLAEIKEMSGEFKASDEFLKAWENWYIKTEMSPAVFNDSRLAGYLERRPTHLMKLSMVMSASRSTGPRMVLTEDDMMRALSYLQIAEERMPQVFGGVGRGNLTPTIQRLLQFCIMRKGQKIPLSEIMKALYHDSGPLQMLNAIEALEMMKVASLVKRPNSQGGDYLIFHGNQSDISFVHNLNEGEESNEQKQE